MIARRVQRAREESLPEQVSHERHVRGRRPVRGPDPFLSDRSVLGDHERLRISGDLVPPVDRVQRIEQDVERQPEPLRKGVHGIGADEVIDANRHDLEIGVGHFALQAHEARHFDDAGTAPRRPDVQDDDFATIILDRSHLAATVHGARREVRRARADLHGKQLVPQHVSAQAEYADQAAHDSGDKQPLLPHRHTGVPHAARNAAISFFGSLAEKIALPATKVVAPAAYTSAIVRRLIPPSTSSTAIDPAASNIVRARATFSTAYEMNSWPPKPGFTVMISRRSSSGMTSATDSTGVAGLSATPAAHPNSLIRANCR